MRAHAWAGLWGLAACMVLAGCPARPARQPAARLPAVRRPAETFPRSGDDYPWARTEATFEPLAARFAPPAGFSRVPVAEGSWGEWLRNLPLRPAGTPVRGRDGGVIVPSDSPHLAAVVDMDVRSNQECADTILRLRAEYLWSSGEQDAISVPLTTGGSLSWADWRSGVRPSLVDERLQLRRTARPSASRASFEGYLDAVFTWCGTYNLAAAGTRVRLADVQTGDYVVHAGSPGHAVLIADLARNGAGQRAALFLQGYMPAQSAHILASSRAEPWFRLDPSRPLDTPFWGEFAWAELRRFGGTRLPR